MCGICGIMSLGLTGKQVDIFRTLMVFSTLRGFQGSGLGVVYGGKKKPPRYLRSLRTAADLAFSPKFEELLEGQKNILFGHARWPTKGEETIENVHPHNVKHILGIHNGTMSRIAGTQVPENVSDSKLLFEAIADKGVEDALDTSFGAYSLVWLDLQKNTLNFLRNHDRPMFFGQIGTDKHTHTIAWASEGQFLQAAFARHDIKNFKIEASKPHHWYVFDMKPGNNIKCADIIDLSPFKTTTYWDTGWSDGKVWDHASNTYVTKEEKEKLEQARAKGKTIAELAKETRAKREALRNSGAPFGSDYPLLDKNGKPLVKEVKNNVVPFVNDMIEKPESGSLLISRFSLEEVVDKRSKFPPSMLDLGCAWCNDICLPSDNYYPISHTKYVCFDCARNPEVADLCDGDPEKLAFMSGA